MGIRLFEARLSEVRSSMNEDGVVCIKCLLEKLDPLNILESVKQKVLLIPEEDKVCDAEYQHRLQICSECEHLNVGTCDMCGCFSIYRAALKNMHCPCSEKLW